MKAYQQRQHLNFPVTFMNKSGAVYTSQRGVVIVVALIMLLVMTSVGVTLMSGATLQEKMSSNTRQFSLAQANAEAGLRRAEQELAANITPNPTIYSAIENFFTNDTTGSRYVDTTGTTNMALVFRPLNDDLSIASGWTTTNSVAAAVTSTSTTLPRYVIEYVGQSTFIDGEEVEISVENQKKISNDPHFFRITAIGYGADDDIVSVLQSMYSTGSNN